MVTAKIGGQEISLYLGMAATIEIERDYGSFENALNEASKKNSPEQREAVMRIAYHLSCNGAELDNEEAPFESAEELMAVCRPYEWANLLAAVGKAVEEGTETTIDAELTTKNSGATQGRQ